MDTSATSSPQPRWRRWKVMAPAAAGVVIVLLLLVWAFASGDNPGESAGLSAKVQLGPLVVSVTESGEVEAERRKLISNELRWSVIILELVEEGTRVDKGQTIVKFECKELTETIERQELEVTSAENNYTQAKQNLELKKEEVDNKILKATRKLDGTVEDRDQYIEHDYPIEFTERDSAVQVAAQRLTLAEDRLAFKKNVNKMPDLESPFSANDIKAEELEVQQLRNGLKKTRLQFQKLQQYEHKRKMRELEEGISDAKLGLKRAKLEKENQLLIAASNEHAKKRTLEMRREKLAERREDEKKLTVTADEPGLVVYDTGRQRWQPALRVAKGEKIRPRQQIMVIPDMSSLQIKTKVYESIIDQVHPDLEAYIRLDSKPGVTFKGRVSKVAPLPDSQNRWLNPGIKVYSVIVQFDDNTEGLKPGMTTEVELVLAELKEVLSVPVAAVFTEKNKTVCYRKNGRTCELVVVKIGRMNDRRVEILSGLARGDEVLLIRPDDMQEDESITPEPEDTAALSAGGGGRPGGGGQ